MRKTEKGRIDKLLVSKGLVPSREKARALILAGQVIVNDRRIDKAGDLVALDADIRIKGHVIPYVGRGGLKLERALDHFDIEVGSKIALDVGSSTGGFTDCLLQRGVERVYAVDVGYGQMALKIRDDARVVLMERTNIRDMKPEDIPERIDIAVVDVSFISLAKVLPHVIPLLKDSAEIVTLIKPQFEVGKGEVGKGGIVRDQSKIEKVIESIALYAGELGLQFIGTVESPILGAKGNREFLAYMKRK